MNLLKCTGWKIIFQWILNHWDIPVNEKADALAKEDCHLPKPIIDLTCSQAFSTIIKSVKNYNCQTLKNDAQGKSWEIFLGNPVPMDLLRQSFAANLRILTKHDYLQGHLHRIWLKNTPDCPLCLNGETMDFKHLSLHFLDWHQIWTFTSWHLYFKGYFVLGCTEGNGLSA